MQDLQVKPHQMEASGSPHFDTSKNRGTLGIDHSTRTFRDLNAKIDTKKSRLEYAHNSKSKHFNMSGARK